MNTNAMYIIPLTKSREQNPPPNLEDVGAKMHSDFQVSLADRMHKSGQLHQPAVFDQQLYLCPRDYRQQQQQCHRHINRNR